LARLGARLRPGALDRALARGADPATSPVLAARACALTADRNRRALAEELEAVRGAHLRPSAWRLAPPRASVEANAATLSELVVLLRSGLPLYARGLAMLAELLADGTGPLYARGAESELASALTDARVALAG
jgi:hypothetical protein